MRHAMAVGAQQMDVPAAQHPYGPAPRAPIQEKRGVALKQRSHMPQPEPQLMRLIRQIALNMRQHHGDILPQQQVLQLLQDAGGPGGKGHFQQQHMGSAQAQPVQFLQAADAAIIAHLSAQKHLRTARSQSGVQPLPCLPAAAQKHLRGVFPGVKVRRCRHGIHALRPKHLQ